MSRGRVCVVGAGVVGLTTATLLQETVPHLQVTVLANKFNEDTLSDGAAGVFRPSASNFRGPDTCTTWEWVQDAYLYYSALQQSPEADIAGVKPLTVNVFSTDHEKIVKNAFLEKLLPEYRMLTHAELQGLPGGPYKYGSCYRTLIIECRRFLPFLMKRFEARGGVTVKRRLTSLEELAGDFDVVVNCGGLAAGDLAADPLVTPIRGQVFKVKAPWITEGYYSDFDTYVLPGFDTVTLGGCRQFDSYNTHIDAHDSSSIWERCVRLVPSLRNAQIVREWTGLRPYRPTVRVETEEILLNSGGTFKVVHNYGHGGYGVTSAPGTAVTAVQHVLRALPASSKL
ncbi:FAD dependent oxidoreductase [Trinorchestia longiramus]|nr:FAD dependent oxidoreductase [Trinorchestia longiramus]